MALRLTNTLTGKKEEFQPFHPPRVTLYVCGVTVYDDCHIGHARGAVVFDVLRRYLESERNKFKVTYVRNITDVDDKIIDRARQEAGEDLKTRVQAVAQRYSQRFQEDFSSLGLLSPDHEPTATQYIPQMVDFIQVLLKRGVAYVGSDGVYFSVRKLSSYGALSHQSVDQLLAAARGESEEGKKDPLDFALWKAAKPEEPSWESPWGPGRPGWHIECTTMSTALLGETFDIHGGGQDLIFPHHENERAQALAANPNEGFAKVWLHNGLLTVNAQKMSKSLGNIVVIGRALERHPADVLRLFFLSAHYRSPIDFTWERFDESARAYERLLDFLTQVDQRVGAGQGQETEVTQHSREKFYSALDDDLNTPEALSALYGLVAQAISWFEAGGGAAAKKLKDASKMVRELGGILGFSFTQEIPDQIQTLIQKRDEMRRKKDFDAADQVRRQLMEEGYIVEDTGGKTVVRKRV